jgi:peptidoglycan/xylan/chitin deacetylase (PgdA/CDA1 family)
MAGVSAVLGRRLKEAYGILTYHRVAEHPAGVDPPTWNVTPAQFRQQLTELLARGYQPWPLRRVLECARTGQPIPRQTFVVTFDDAYGNVHLRAWPILCELGVPATVFVATAYLDWQRPFPFDDWTGSGLSAVPPESWFPLASTQIREMLGSGLIDLGTHTHTHADFRGRADLLEQELRTSLECLRAQFGLTDATFAFPYGICGPELSAAARRAGVLCALTTLPNLVTPESDPYSLGRFDVGRHDTGSTLAAKLDGWYSLGRDAWLRMRAPIKPR